MTADVPSPADRLAALRRATGDVAAGFEPWAAHDPESFALFASFAGYVHDRGALSSRERALVTVALQASTTHLHEAGLRRSIDWALESGATTDEIVEVFELVCGLGMHSMIEGLPLLADELGTPAADEATASARARVRESFEDRRGYWSDFWETVLEMDHAFLDRYTALSAHPWEHGDLEPKLREFVYIAIDASTTHLYTPGLSAHLSNAIEYGATRDELLEVIELTSLQGYDTMAVGMPILREVARDRGLLE